MTAKHDDWNTILLLVTGITYLGVEVLNLLFLFVFTKQVG